MPECYNYDHVISFNYASSPPHWRGCTAIITSFICLFDRSAKPDWATSRVSPTGLPSQDGGRWVLRRQKEQGLAEHVLGYPDSLSTSKHGALKEPLQGFKEEIGGRKSEGQGFCVLVTMGCPELASLHIGGPVPGDKLFQ